MLRRYRLVFLVFATLLGPNPADAAVRRCWDFIATAGEDRASESIARQKAMAAWTEKAALHGEAFKAWRLAIDRSFSCLKLPDGTHRCQILARPCGISQVPSNMPPGALPPEPPKAPKKEQRI